MARGIKCQRKALQYGERSLIAQRMNPPQHGEDILLGVMGNLVLPVFHDFQAVVQKNPGQIRSHGCHINGNCGIGFADYGQSAYMIHVGMTDKDSVQPALLLYGAEIGKRVFPGGLTDAAVHQDAPVRNSDIYGATANLHGAAEKM